MHNPYLKQSQPRPPCIILYGRRAACRWWSGRSCCDKQEVRCRASLNLSRLRYGCQRCTSPAKCTRTFNFQEIFKRAFTVYGHKRSRMHTHLRNAVPLMWGSLRVAPIMSVTRKCSTLWGWAWASWYNMSLMGDVIHQVNHPPAGVHAHPFTIHRGLWKCFCLLVY